MQIHPDILETSKPSLYVNMGNWHDFVVNVENPPYN